MSLRNFNNSTTVGQLTGPVAGSATTLTTTGFTGSPAVPFTVTLDRNTASEEIVLVTANASGTLTVTRGYDGTSAQSHAAGCNVEHTAGAVEFTEANAHVNATTGVHGASGTLVSTAATQTVFSKTLVSPVLQADSTLGDAVVAFVPSAASSKNLFRGIAPSGSDVITVDATGNLNAQTLGSTGATNVHGALTVTGTSTLTGNATASGTLAVTGAATVTGNANLNGGATIPTTKTLNGAGAINVTGNINGAAIGATGDITTLSNLTVSGSGTVGTQGAGATAIAQRSYVDSAIAAVIAAKFQAGRATATITAGTSATGTVTFPTAFASAPYVTLVAESGSVADIIADIVSTPTTTTFSWRVKERSATTGTYAVSLVWFAFMP